MIKVYETTLGCSSCRYCSLGAIHVYNMQIYDGCAVNTYTSHHKKIEDMDQRMSKSFKVIWDRFERRRQPIVGEIDYGLPPADVNLSPFKSNSVIEVTDFKFSSINPSAFDTNIKLDALASAFSGGSELILLHAYLVSHIRKRSWPENAAVLFHRLWEEEHQFLLENLSLRWVLSAIISFGSVGKNEDQRVAGVAFNMFYSLMKLTEFERTFSGFGRDQEFKLGRKEKELPMGFSQYSLKNGDLDINTIAQLYEIGNRDNVIRRPCEFIMKALLDDPATIFGRLDRMKKKLKDRSL